MADSDNGTTLNGKVNITVDSGQAVNELNKASTSSEDLFKHIEKLEKAFTSMEASIKASTSSIKDFASASSTQNMSAEERLKYEKEITAQKRAQAREAKAETENINQRINLQREKNKGSTWSQQRSTPEYISNKYANDASDRAHNAARDDYMAFNKEYKAMHDRYSSKNIWGNAFNDIGRNLSSGGGLISSFAGSSLQILGDRLRSPMMGLATAATQATSAVVNFAHASMQAYGDIQKLQVQMGVVYGSQSQANAAFQGIQSYAVKSPFGVEQTTEMAVLLKQSGVYGSELLDTMKMIGDVSSGNNEKMKRIANNYAQIEAIGKASMLDMRQFAYAGIPIYKEVAKQLGVSQTTLRQMISDGKVTSDIMEKVFKNMTSYGGAFYGAVEKGSNTISARLQNMEDIKKLMLSSSGEFLNNIGNTTGTGGLYSGLLSWEEGVFKGIKQWADDSNIAKNVKQIADGNSKIDQLESLLTYLKDNKGNSEVIKEIKDEIKSIRSVISPEQQIAIGESSYQMLARKEIENQSLYYGHNSYVSTLAQRDELQSRISDINATSAQGGARQEDLIQLEKLNSLLEIMVKKGYDSNVGYFVPKESTQTQDSLSAHYQTVLQSAINKFSDSVDKFQNGVNGPNSIRAEYQQLMANTPEGKAKALEEYMKPRMQLKDDAQRLYKSTNNGSNLSNLTVGDLLQLRTTFMPDYQNISPLNYNYLNNDKESKENLNALADNFDKLIPMIKKGVGENNTSISWLNDANKDIRTIIKNGTVTQKDLDKLVRDVDSAVGILNNGGNKQYADLLLSAYRRGDYNFNDRNMNESLFKNGGINTIDVEPLWKRIIASVTGLDVSKITGNAYSAMSDYLGFARKNTVGNTLGTMLTSGGYGGARMNFLDAVNMIQTNGTAYNTVSGNKNDKNKTAYNQIGGPAGPTQQIDWVSMEKDMMQMAMAGKMNSTVVETLKQGYQTQLDTMDKLFVSAITTGEQGQYSADTKQQMLNAFGKLNVDKNGIINGMYNGSAVSLKQTVDQAGNTTWTDTKTNQVFNTLDGIEGAYESLFEFLKQYDKEMAKKVEDLAKIDIKKVYEENLDKRTLTAQRGLYGAGYGYTQALGSLIDSGMGAQQAADIAKTITENIYTQIQKAVEADKTKVFTDQEITDMVNRETNAQLAENRLAHYRAGIASRYGTIDSNGYSFSKGFLNGIGTTVPENGNTYIEQQYANNHGIQGKMDYATKQGILFQEINNQGLGGELAKHIGLNESSSQDSLQSAISNLPISELDKMTNAIMESDNAAKDLSDTMNSVGSSIGSMSKELAGNMITGTFEQIGESMAKGSDAMDGIGEKMRELGQAALSNLGSLFVQAGLSYIAAHPTWSGLGVGMALIAAGGMASLASGLMTSDTEEDTSSSDDEVSKLKSIKEQLSDLLEQARSDAIYYENELKHKNALSTDTRLSNTVTGTSVNDAIIAPNGNVITTHPNDYLVATKDPGALINNDSRSSSPNVNISIQNNSGQQLSVTQQKKDNNGNIDIVAVIEQVAGQYIASSKSDDAFSARNYRQQGHVVTA